MTTKLKPYYKTSDYGLAAWLCVRGYTLLCALDEDEHDYNGHPVYSFILTHAELSKRPEELLQDVNQLREDYNKPFIFEHDVRKKPISFREYHVRLRMVKQAVREPKTKQELEQL